MCKINISRPRYSPKYVIVEKIHRQYRIVGNQPFKVLGREGQQETEDARELATVHSKLASVAYISSLNDGFPTIQCGSLDWWTSEKFGRRREMASIERRLSDARPGREARRCEQPGPKKILQRRATRDERRARSDGRRTRQARRGPSDKLTTDERRRRRPRRATER